MGDKKHTNKIPPPPPKSRDNPVKMLFMCFLLYVLLRSQLQKGQQVCVAAYEESLRSAPTCMTISRVVYFLSCLRA